MILLPLSAAAVVVALELFTVRFSMIESSYRSRLDSLAKKSSLRVILSVAAVTELPFELGSSMLMMGKLFPTSSSAATSILLVSFKGGLC